MTRSLLSKDGRAYFQDILNSIRLIEEFVLGMSFEDFKDDEKTVAAVERKLLVISEAAIRLGETAQELCPDTPWRDIRGLGNWIRHQYGDVDSGKVWEMVVQDVPPLKAAVTKVLELFPLPTN